MWRKVHNICYLSYQQKNTAQKISNIFHRPHSSFCTSHFPFKPSPSQNHPQTAQTGVPLQFECNLSIPSSISVQTCSSTFLTTYASYPEAKARSVVALTTSTIFTFLTCRWSSLARFRSFQDKVNIGIASLDLKEAVPIITLHWKYLNHQIQLQLNR